VSCYLYEYGRTRDKALRTKYSDSFFIYLLAASWKKVHAHFSSWQALGFIQALENGVIEDGLLDNIMEIGKDYGPLGKPGDDDIGPGDRTLAGFLSLNKDLLCERIRATCNDLPPNVRLRLSKLLDLSPSESEDGERLTFSAFFSAVKLTLEGQKALYTQQTAWTFHFLLYLSFLIAGRAVSGIKDCYVSCNIVEHVR
jgi:hypothetical protein